METLIGDYPSLLLILICLLTSAFFSSAETAITSLGTMKVKHLLDSRGSEVSAFNLWLIHPGRVLTTILFFNTVVNMLASSIATQIAYKHFDSGAIGIATGIMTFLVLVFGEILPKAYAKAHAERLGIISMKIIYAVYYMTYPIVRFLSAIAEFIIHHASDGKKRNPLITEEEIEFMLSEGEKAGVIGEMKKEIIEGAFDFDETKVREIMTPRTNLTALRSSTPLNELLETIKQTGHSRIPIFAENIDHITGVVLAKDLLAHIQASDLHRLTAKDIVRNAVFVPESKSIMAVFKELTRSKSHLAIIIDEYGGTAGIVTMEDILEEIVGDIQDEYDTEEPKITQKSENEFEISGDLNVEDFFQYFHIDPEDVFEDSQELEVDTVAGLVMQYMEGIPSVGQSVHIHSLKIEILAVSRRRIDLVKVVKSQETKQTSQDKTVHEGF